MHEVAHGDDGTLGTLQLLREVRRAGLFFGVQEVVLVGGQAVAAQFLSLIHI